MEKVRFSCPRCHTLMQAGVDRIGSDVACPQCNHQFRLVDDDRKTDRQTTAFGSDPDAPTMPPASTRDPAAVPNVDVKHGSANDLANDNRDTAKSPSSFYPPAGAAPQPTGGRFVCPYCQTTQPPRWESEVSTIGWIVFAVLLVTTCFLCFIGLFIRDNYRVCSQCRVRLDR